LPARGTRTRAVGDPGREYLKIALRLRRLVPGWVENYTGPPELIDEVGSEDVAAERLGEAVRELAEVVLGAAIEPDRRGWLLAQLQAISAALHWLGGERLEYATLFERCHGAPVATVADRHFEQAHGLLDRALPGHGDVRLRYRAWRQTQLVPRARLQAGLSRLAGEMRRRCRERFGLPDGEQVSWELVRGVPWAGNADYLGNRATTIRINAELPISSPRLLELVCHEAYPGHHTESVCKDASLIEPSGRDELAVYVYPSPQALISEGLASLALDALLGDEAEQLAAECLEPAGIPYDHQTAAVVRKAEELLLPLRSNIALMQDARTPPAQIREYAHTWLLDDDEHIDNAIAHIKARAWRPYESCYPVGLALCRRYAAADPSRFRSLLHHQLTPADITP
jgi:hypothetical protein